jgi:superfamily II DNA or RNA helicase
VSIDIFVSKKNESFLQISCEDSVAQELSEYFAFFVPGFQYAPLFKKKIWDGKIRLFDRRYNTLPSGLVSYLEKFAADRAYTLGIDDAVRLTTNLSIAEAKLFAEQLKLPHIPHDYQIEAFTKSVRYRRALIVSPTASGKSLIIYMIIRHLQQNHHKGLVIVPTTSLVEQLYADFKSYGWNVDTHAHRIYAGKEKHTKHFLTISTWQTLHLQTPEYLSQFDFVIGDEAHQFKGKALSQIMGHLINADTRIGTTGTLDGTKTHRLVLEGHFGPVFQSVTTKQLMDDGKLAELKIKCLVLKYPESICKSLRKSTYQEEYDAVVLHQSRAKFIRNLTLSLEGNTLVLFQLVKKHGHPTFEGLRDATDKHQVFFIHGGVETEDREEVRRITEISNNAIIVASYGTFSTGINIKNLHNVIFAAPSKSKIRNLQSIGRGLRLSNTKTHATLFDIVDDLRIGKHENFLLKHFIERIGIYTTEKFSIKHYHIDIKE